MAKWLSLVLAAGGLHAAVIRGAVVEHQTGRPLARTLVTVLPVAGTAGVPLSTRTNVYGNFEFPRLSAGAWLVSAARRSFAPVQFGQKRFRAAGIPIVLEASGMAVANLRMQRLGGITGTVIDENEVGLPEHEVIAYRNTRPLQPVGRATTDDRGMYRLGSLEPGAYLVRTGAKRGTDESYVPTFSRQTNRADESIAVDVELDRDTTDVGVRPLPGRLSLVTGRVTPPAVATVTLVSDTGSQNTTSNPSGEFRFDSLAPGRYEVFAQTAGDRRAGPQSAYTAFTVDRDQVDVRARLGVPADIEILVEDLTGQPVDLALFQLSARRKNLAVEGKPETLRTRQGHVSLAAGRWDLSLLPTAGYYVAQFTSPSGGAATRPDGWNEITVDGDPMRVKFVLSPNPGMLHGAVARAGHAVAGAPVYLEAYDPDSHRRLTDLRQTTADLQGAYEFVGLPPGSYRILSTFEYRSPDPAAMEASRPRLIKVEESREAQADLELYVLP